MNETEPTKQTSPMIIAEHPTVWFNSDLTLNGKVILLRVSAFMVTERIYWKDHVSRLTRETLHRLAGELG